MANPIELQPGAGFSVTVSFFEDPEMTKPAKVDGVPEWTCDPEGAVTLEPAADGMSARGKAGGEATAALVTVKADADPSSAVEDLFGTLEVHIKDAAGKAAFVKMDATPDVINPL